MDLAFFFSGTTAVDRVKGRNGKYLQVFTTKFICRSNQNQRNSGHSIYPMSQELPSVGYKQTSLLLEDLLNTRVFPNILLPNRVLKVIPLSCLSLLTVPLRD